MREMHTETCRLLQELYSLTVHAVATKILQIDKLRNCINLQINFNNKLKN